MNFKQKSVICLATGCFIGNISFAPGTFGSILGLPLCFFLSKINLTAAVFLVVIFIFFAIWIAQEAENVLEKKDPGCIVIDEIAGLMVTLLGLPFNLFSAATGFLNRVCAWGYCMLKSIMAAIVLSALVVAAYPPCPLDTKLRCTQGFDGKVVCGCG